MRQIVVSNLKPWHWFLVALLGWTMLAAIPTSSAYLAAGSGGSRRWLLIFSYIGPYYLLWAVATFGIYWLTTGLLDTRRGWPRAITGHIVVMLGLSITFGLVVHQSNWHTWLLGGNAPGYHAMSAFSYALILIGIYFYRLQQRVQEQETIIAQQEKQAARLEADLARAQIDTLRAQVNPHFLFNTLNCIGALIETGDNQRAYQVLEDVGALLRTSLEHRHHDLVPLQEELDFTQRYVAMERVRFGDRLTFELDIRSNVATWQVPPFILQPLIENSIKHVVATSHGTVSIRVTAKADGDCLRLSVLDSGPDESSQRVSSKSGTGVGLENLRNRLALIYHSEARLDYSPGENGTCVTLLLPQPKADNKEITARQQETTDQGILSTQH